MEVSDINWDQLLKKSFEDFTESELCFLALTSKPEAAIRNKVAWNLYRNQKEIISNPFDNCVIGRECSRIDMAIFDDNGSEERLLGVEFKVATAANMIEYESLKKAHLEDFREDLKKHNFEAPLVTIFYEALEMIPDKYSSVIKYHKRHNKIKDHSRTNRKLKGILENELKSLKGPREIMVQRINPYTVGEYLGIPVRFHGFIINKS